MSDRLKFALLFISILAFRTAFGLSQPFFDPDELQTYLIGLKYYATGAWPYFGPDLIVTETGFHTQIPGALEGLLIALPLHLLPVPEAPFLLLNLLSTSALALLAWYVAKRLPELPFAFVFAWASLLPWNLHESTNPLNPSYLLFGSILFFIGFFEAVPDLSLRWISPPLAFGLMGFGLFWDMQFHYSWVLLPPFLLAAFFLNGAKAGSGLLPRLGGFAAGGAVPLVFLIPTFLKYGLSTGTSGLALAEGFNPDNFSSFFTILARFLSLPSFEIPRFLGSGTTERLAFLKTAPWLIPPAAILIGVGWLQPLVLAVWGWFKDPRHKDARAVQGWTFLTFLGVWVSFWFSSKPPSAHLYYILLPLVTVHSFYIWSRLATRRAWRLAGVVFIGLNLWFEGGYLARMMGRQSLYVNRPLVVKAIEGKDYRLLGERRPGSLY